MDALPGQSTLLLSFTSTLQERISYPRSKVFPWEQIIPFWKGLSHNHDCSRQHSKIFSHCFSEKIRLDVSSESSAGQRIHLKNQALFSLQDITNKRAKRPWIAHLSIQARSQTFNFEIWVTFDQGQRMTLTFDTHSTSLTHWVECFKQHWDLRLQQFPKKK